ncbi:MAG: hypothetical protein WB476_06110, partial [Azonexus sp.]
MQKARVSTRAFFRPFLPVFQGRPRQWDAPFGKYGAIAVGEQVCARRNGRAANLINWRGFAAKMVGGAQCRIGLPPESRLEPVTP